MKVLFSLWVIQKIIVRFLLGRNGLHIVLEVMMMLMMTGWSRDVGGGVGVAPAGIRNVSAGSG